MYTELECKVINRMKENMEKQVIERMMDTLIGMQFKNRKQERTKEDKMSKFSNAKMGDRVWGIKYGWGTIYGPIDVKDERPVQVLFDIHKKFLTITFFYDLDGKYCNKDIRPELFWNEFHIPTDEEDKKPFDLVEFLKENLKPKKFEHNKENNYIYYDYDIKGLYYSRNVYQEMSTVYFSNSVASVCNELTKRGVTWEQLKQAYKQLGWV